MANGTPEQAALVREAIEQRSDQRLTEIVTAIEDCGALDYTMERARTAVDEAKDQLAFLPEGEQKTALQQLASFAVERTV
jgi:octaprenyl-diphosphate synthase